jgi:predicted transcriptional regulator
MDGETALARKLSSILTDAELRLMEVVWGKGSVTVSDVVEALLHEVPLHYSTVLTTLRILEGKGYLNHTKDGRAYVYKPLVAREQEREKALAHLLRRFFGGSPEMLMLNLVERRQVSPRELKSLQKRIAEDKS